MDSELLGAGVERCHGLSWDMKSNKEMPFVLDLQTGVRIPARE